MIVDNVRCIYRKLLQKTLNSDMSKMVLQRQYTFEQKVIHKCGPDDFVGSFVPKKD